MLTALTGRAARQWAAAAVVGCSARGGARALSDITYDAGTTDVDALIEENLVGW